MAFFKDINKKLLGFAGFLAGFIVLVMIGGIWFYETWIASLWFWLAAVGCLGVSLTSLVFWRIDSAYAGVELEPGDLEDEDESELKKGAPKPAPRPTSVAIAKAKQPMKIAGIIQKPAAKQPAPSQKPSATPQQQPAKPAPKAQPQSQPSKPTTPAVTEVKPVSKTVPFASTMPSATTGTKATQKDAASTKLATQLQSMAQEEQEAEEPEEVLPHAPAKKIRLNRGNVQALIAVYRDEGYHAVSFSKFRAELGVGKDRESLKLKKLLLEAVAMGFLAKKGSRYIIQREGQEPLE